MGLGIYSGFETYSGFGIHAGSDDMRLKQIWTVFIFAIMMIVMSVPAIGGMGQMEDKKRDPYLDDLEKRMKDEWRRMKKEFEGYIVSHARVDCQIKTEERFFSAQTSLSITVPSGKKRFPLLIFEDFTVERIELMATSFATSSNVPDSSSTVATGTGVTIAQSPGSMGTSSTQMFTDLKYERIIPHMNVEADEYMKKMGIEFSKIHFNSGEKVPRLPHILWIELPSENMSNSTYVANLMITYSGKLERMDQHPFTKFQVFLNGGEFWIPGLIDSKPTTELIIHVDRPWHVFAQGKLLKERIDEKSSYYEYASSIPQLEPVIIAGDYRVDKGKFMGIDLYGFYLSDDEGGKAVMVKSKEYIEYFSNLIGKYPFESFAIIESPAPVGYGYPSFTAIGTLVMRMHFTEPFALGHEILHNWWGNYVEIPSEKGNWCEALTTYMSNYHYVEEKDGATAALHERRRNLENLSIYLGGKDEFPLKDFEYNKGNVDQVVGYTKGFFMLHETRRIIGDEAFFKALRNFYTEYGGREAGWNNLLEEFKKESVENKDRLDKVFEDFLKELGIPSITLDSAVLHKDTDGGIKYRITGAIGLEGNFHQVFDFPYEVVFKNGLRESGKIDLVEESTEFEFSYEYMPLSISFDSGMNVCRYISDVDRALNINRFWDEAPASVLVPNIDGLYREISEPIEIKGEKVPFKAFADYKSSDTEKDDLMIFANAEDLERFESLLETMSLVLPDGFKIEKNRIVANNKNYEGSDMALLITLSNPKDRKRTISILYATSPDELKKARGRIRFYGDYGWVVFKDVKVQDKGNFTPENITMTEQFKEMIVCTEGMCVTEEITR